MNAFSTWNGNIRNRTGWRAVLTTCGAICACIGTLGCGIASSPHPPSLQLPKPIGDLKATRIGNSVRLSWTVPDKTTDGLNIRGPVQMQIYRRLETGAFYPVGTISLEPDKPGDYADRLPSTLVSGSLRPIFYDIVGVNRNGRSAGPSNTASTLAGEAPPPIRNLSVRMVERGVVIQWRSAGNREPDTFIQLTRTLLRKPTVPDAKRQKQQSGLLSPNEPPEQILRVSPQSGNIDPGNALDIHVGFDRKYRYTAARVTRMKIGQQWLQATSDSSLPVDISTLDTFPPAAPTGLVAVPMAATMNGGKVEVDLSWSANTEPDIADYLVYRRNVSTATPAQAVDAAEMIAPRNPDDPIVAPVFRDSNVRPGNSYAYSIVAVDRSGNRSARSGEVQTTIPQ